LSNAWYLDEEYLSFYVNNFNPNRKKQIGQKELLNTSDYDQLKEDYPDSNLNKLKYKNS